MTLKLNNITNIYELQTRFQLSMHNPEASRSVDPCWCKNSVVYTFYTLPEILTLNNPEEEAPIVKAFENIYQNQHFLLFQQCFLP